MEPFLDRIGIEAALKHLDAAFPNKPMTAEQREAWTEVLANLHPGELKKALAGEKYRPDPYPTLERVQTIRKSQVTERPQLDSWNGDPRKHPAIVKAKADLLKAKGAA